MLEAIDLVEEVTGNRLQWEYEDTNRKGDHIWWISDLARFESHYPGWTQEYDIPTLLREIHESNRKRWAGK